MKWSRGYSASYLLKTVDRVSWHDVDEMNFISGSITRQTSDLVESADLEMDEDPKEKWVRVYLRAQQNDEETTIPIFTGLTSSPQRKLDGKRSTYPVTCYSVLKPAKDILLKQGWYAPAGSNANTAAKLLTGPAPVIVEEKSPVLASSIVAGNEETNLSMAQKIVSAIGWQIQITGTGEIHICSYNTKSKAVFSALDEDLLENSITIEDDWYSCPNVLRVVQNGTSYTVKDNNKNSPLSIQNRGREIWKQETDVSLNSGETLSSYTVRRLKELQSSTRTVSYDRRYYPDIYVGDMITLHYPDVDIQGDFFIKSQSIELGYNCKTSEECYEYSR